MVGIFVLIIAFAFNEWAFRFGLDMEPIDSFLRLMTLVLDGFILAFVLAVSWKKAGLVARVQDLARSYPRSTLSFVGLFLAYCTVMAVEFGCRFYFKYGYEAPYSEKTYWEPSAVRRDSVLGSCLPPDTVISHAYVINDSLIYKRYYQIDHFGRRDNPKVWPDSIYRQFAMITGCSFAFGYGLSDEQTLSHYIDSLTQLRGYNYGVSGHGTQQTLALLQSRSIRNEISEPNGVLVHLFIDEHIQRLIGSRRLIKLWASNYPYYYLEGDELKRDGSFWTGRHWLSRFYRAISESAFFGLFNIDVPWYVSDSHIKLFGAVLREARKEFQMQYPEGRFLVVIAPNSTLAPRVRAALEANEVEVLDLSKLLDKEEKQYKIHWTEAHPNGNYYLKVAEELDRYLNSDSSAQTAH